MTKLRMMQRRLKRMALVCLMAAASATCQSHDLHAQETHDSSELCGWIDDLSEITQPRPAPTPTPYTLAPQFFTITIGDQLSITTCNYDAWLKNALKTASSDTTASENVVRVEQTAEPYVTVGSESGDSLQKVLAFQSWFDDRSDLKPLHQSPWPRDYVPVVDFNGELGIQKRDGIVMIETTPQDAPPSQSQRFVGSSPVIATIREAYHPYDLADQDLTDQELADASSPDENDRRSDAAQVAELSPVARREIVWVDGIFTPAAQPFCIRSLVDGFRPNWSPLLSKSMPVKDQVSQKTSVEQSSEFVYGSPDCWLDELVWNVNAALEDENVASLKLRPGQIGQQVASLVVSGDRLASRVAGELALVWPAAKPPVEPPPGIGARLLARAQAVERLSVERPVAEQPKRNGSAEPFTPEQLAHSRAMLLQWVGVAQSVIDDLSHRLTDVTEVARSRGAQDEPTRR